MITKIMNIDYDSKESGMNCSNIKNLTTRVLAVLALASASIAGLTSVAEAANCATCHGTSVSDIRPFETAPFRNITTGSIKGSHAKHITTAPTLGTACTPCHGIAAASYTTNHRSGFINVTTNSTTTTGSLKYSSGAKIAQSGTSAPTTLGTCSTAYCHSSGQASPAYAVTPAWGTAANLTCNGCHGTGNAYGSPDYVNAAAPNQNSHSAHASSAADCIKCHTGTVTVAGTAILGGSVLHTNSARDVNFAAAYDTNGATTNYNTGTKTCSAVSCHGASAPQWGGAALLCSACHTANNTLAGKHSKHYGVATVALTGDKTASNTSAGTVYEYSCGVCHNPGTTSHAGGVITANQAAEVSFDPTIAVGGTYVAGGALAGTDAGLAWSAGTCSATYCHSQGTSTTTPFGGAANTAATWAAAQTLTCEGCHSFNAGATNKMSTGKHTAHIYDGTIMTNIACSACHVSTTSDSVTIANTALHANKLKEVTIAATYDNDATPANNWAASTCSNVYCHSDGQATPTYKPVLWTATISDCKSCHNFDANSGVGAIMVTGKHSEHISQAAVLGTNYGCQDCHSTVTTNGTSITTPANHINKTRDVSMATRGGGTWTTPNCTSTYCHSSGQATPVYANPGTWTAGAALGCNGCHGTGNAYGSPNYASGLAGSATANSHSTHATSAADCVTCHTGTVTVAGTAILGGSVLHTNQLRDVNLAAAYDTNGATANYIAGTTKTCSATSCHGSGASPQWGGNSNNATCTKCHGTATATITPATEFVAAPVAATPVGTGQVDAVNQKTGAHQTHLQYFNGLSAQGVDAAARCQVCHGTLPTAGTHATGTATAAYPVFQGLAKKDNTAFNATYAGTGLTCNVYCHNPAGTGGTLTNAGTTPTPTWTNAGLIAAGTLKTRTNCNTCHKVPGDATFSFASLHTSSGVTDTTTAVANNCVGCHGHEGSGANHMDGFRDAAGSCNGCHDYDTVGSTYTAGKWSYGTWGKTNYGGYPTAEGSGAHATHINYIKTRLAISTPLVAAGTFGSGEAANVCGTCHTNAPAGHTTGATGTALTQGRSINFGDTTFKIGGTTGTNFQFGVSNPAYSPTTSGLSGQSSSVSPKTCSNISCHYFTTPLWSTY
jgi:predicted CxxxxCH...CXXCH cytochrome family protein